jgi:hypothetical protein
LVLVVLVALLQVVKELLVVIQFFLQLPVQAVATVEVLIVIHLTLELVVMVDLVEQEVLTEQAEAHHRVVKETMLEL